MFDESGKILSGRIKAYAAPKCLPDGFSNKLIASIKRKRRNFAIKVVSFSFLAIFALIFAVSSLEVPVERGSVQCAFVAGSERSAKREWTALMLLGMLRECIFRNRSAKKEEAENGD